MENTIFAKISSGLAEIQFANKTGEVTKKTITVKDFLDIIQGAVREEEKRLGSMPKGYYDLKLASLEDNTYKIYVVVKGERRKAEYFEEEFVIPYPDLFFSFSITKGNVTGSKCFALKDAVTSDDSMLYHFPLANVHNSGEICWGSNNLPEIEHFSDIDFLVSLFFSSPYNEDLFDMEHLSEKYRCSQLEIFQMLSSSETFPVDMLKETGKTVGELIG